MIITKEPAVKLVRDEKSPSKFWVTRNGFKCGIDDVIEAALQPDFELAQIYRGFLRLLAPEINVVVSLEKDGHPEGNKVSWFGAEIRHKKSKQRINNTLFCCGDTLIGWNPTDAQTVEQIKIVLDKCREIGLVI